MVQSSYLGVTFGAILGWLAAVPSAVWAAGVTPSALEPIARQVTGPEDRASIDLLREAGPAGAEAFVRLHLELTTTTSELSFERRREPAEEALDLICGQRDVRFSRLFWYTDFEQAKKAASAEGKPILSLRLLGKLTDDLSCANSRFFRTVLYANKSVSDYLRKHYILHWESVRPAPVIEIDYGNGRKIRRTITGNSIHYVLDSRGRLIDGLPGLYAPGTFLSSVEELHSAAKTLGALEDGEFRGRLIEYHRAALDKTEQLKQRLLAADTSPRTETAGPGQFTFSAPPPASAAAATERTQAKGRLEGAPLTEVLPSNAASEATMQKLAAALVPESRLDSHSRDLIRHKNPELAMRMAVSKAFVETPMLKMVRNLEQNIALDTARNEFELHPRIHRWLMEGESPANLRTFNERVYSELFLTPSSDPWLGLVPPDTYAALDGQGVVGKDSTQKLSFAEQFQYRTEP